LAVDGVLDLQMDLGPSAGTPIDLAVDLEFRRKSASIEVTSQRAPSWK
jgi:hypothetical protein